jgi:phenylacetate-CoA ligase
MQILHDVALPDWPAIPHPSAAAIWAVLAQQLVAERDDPVGIQHAQRRQITHLCTAAKASALYWSRLSVPGSGVSDDEFWAWWHALPGLDRATVRDHAIDLTADPAPPSHGRIATVTTGGSTGRPVTVRQSELANLYWRAATLRGHLWRRHDFAGHAAAIRRFGDASEPDMTGLSQDDWGHALSGLVQTGPSSVLDIRVPVDRQAVWLRETDPDYLLVLPSTLSPLLDEFQRTGATPSRLRDIRTMGEVVEPDLRERTRDVLGVEIADSYSANDTTVMALDCDQGRLHVLSDTVRLDIVDHAGRGCPPGTPGRILVTPLHNYAMPMMRYDIGDIGAWSTESCPCGRSYPVIERIIGRAFDGVILPDGRRVGFTLYTAAFSQDGTVRQYQVVQKSRDALEVRVVARGALNDGHRLAITKAVQEAVGYPFAISIREVSEIERAPSGKYLTFRSEL